MLPQEPSSTLIFVAQSVRNDGRYRGAVLDQADEATRLGEGFAWRQPAVASGKRRAPDAAAASRQQGTS